VSAIIYKSLLRPARNGETVKCGDGRNRVLFPGIPYHSLDGEEACSMCACRAALANFPCPRCLVPKAELHSLLKEFTPRTTESMKRVYEAARDAQTKAEQEQILQSHGLHLTEVIHKHSIGLSLQPTLFVRTSSGLCRTRIRTGATLTMSCISMISGNGVNISGPWYLTC
jgi:hypothetical protein